ncbi:hypothetical protein IMG5_051610 [Ichthyophthirius multifiliis]|uniref:S1 motif domain-containing protein n=1 Tax=Ichthyophthirius multifiliis TaxID=5932 RepID=G0QMT0_ICHMU|nr:hypothetical protein IMG5_051610 [Ichthyophthirius multifiliis]EGR33483.1 hypothetical protein IMG5_051610 [Ichthyophthirius multifiliis]|eukprot:XP_004037469.1 hypothetical protein IMG5_051610 [Ichthyophthirius multifiliis]
MITPNEMTKQMQQSIQKVLKIGRTEVVQVLRVDEEKGYIDLSKKKVRNNQDAACLDNYSKAKTVNSILITICESDKQITIDELYTKVVWPLSKKYKSAYEAFRASLNDNQVINQFDVSEDIKQKLLKEIQRRLAPQTLRIKAEVELRCYGYEGVDAIKAALLAGESKSRNNCQVGFEIVGSPVYAGTINTQDKNLGLEVIKDALKAVEEVILSKNGQYKLRGEPKIYGDKAQDDLELIEKAEEDDDEDEQKEGEGDDDDEESEEIEGMGDADDDEEEFQQQ